jgi:hypothetical protein
VIEKYRFRTSLGYVYISFDPEEFVSNSLESENISIDRGGGYIANLYSGELGKIFKAKDGSLWVDIYLEDGMYGSPEYLLEKCEMFTGETR